MNRLPYHKVQRGGPNPGEADRVLIRTPRLADNSSVTSRVSRPYVKSIHVER